ncbi:uncharacterized protein K460DRAFT_349973 [Cucurbitaria berberidis CBS 394.84]|uniref:Uncharacterized protein n=1 Tax=Cucurbitaria berberidis CBS 394.84 TaxID=1168544 RepID=A0A9P4GQB5_9PLEO|nr:uncharacterized protein K460DRAFT_349973 [Cucurbitaria berberidis CBS 394.84]KAF1849827.1 hypothetical protein K460DRAFT_349973 [Cucurbitaria berberidis CBS 394.84]
MSAAQKYTSMIPFLVSRDDNNFQFCQIPINEGDNNTAIVDRIKSLERATNSKKAKRALHTLAMRKLSIGTVRLLEAPLETGKAQIIPTGYVGEKKRHDMMTNVLFNPATPIPTTHTLYVQLISGVRNDEEGHTKAWGLDYAIDGHAACIWLALALVAALVVGLVIGISTGDGKLGLGIGGGLLAASTAIQAAILMRTIY